MKFENLQQNWIMKTLSLSTGKEILNEYKNFYKRLYSSNKCSQNELTNSVFFSSQTEQKLVNEKAVKVYKIKRNV